jgi:glycerophosphoryl diester phosphodiesterase
MKNKENKKRIQERIRPILQTFPYIFSVQIATKAIIAVWMLLLGKIFQALLRSSGRVAVTSGDFKFLFTTWQGIGILLLGLVSLFIYVAFDLNTKVVLSRNLLTGEDASPGKCMKEGFLSVGKLINLQGSIVVLYISLIAPLLGVGLSISLTRGLYIPTFITAVIKGSVLYSALAGVAVLLFLSGGIANLFILHGIVIDKMTIGEAGRQSGELIKANWKDYLKQNIMFILLIAGVLAGIAVVFLFIPLKLISILSLPATVSRLLTIFFVAAGVIVSALADLFSIPLYMIKMTQLFFSYKQGQVYEWKGKVKENHTGRKGLMIVVAVAVIAVVFIINANFDRLFPPDTNVKIIAHRSGGNEGKENTLSGLERAWKAGAYGSEIDIQRTRDGHYILNHDGTFKRVAGVKRKPEEMTLREVKKLSINGEPVPTFEEMLKAGKGRMVLFTELKGKSADRRMARDAVRLVKKYHMEKECVLISLKYDLIDYIESRYPEIQTGFLTFASFGKTAALNCDYIGLEEESATRDTIHSIHREGKKALVWTANEKGSQKHFLCTNVDGIITDNVTQAKKITSGFKKRSDLDRMVDKVEAVI